jgi:hypothetical protein
MLDKVTKLRRTRDTVARMIMMYEEDLMAVLADYLLVPGHIGEALMGQIYDETFIKKFGLTPTNRD